MSTMRGRVPRRPLLYIDLEPDHKIACSTHRYKLKRPDIVLEPEKIVRIFKERGWRLCEVVAGCELLSKRSSGSRRSET